MGIRRLAATADRTFATVSVLDTAIGPAADLAAFVRDRSDLSVLDLRAAPADRPWEAAATFDIRALTDFEVQWALGRGRADATALGAGDALNAATIQRWCFRLGCAGWSGVWRAPGPGETGPVPVPWEARAGAGGGLSCVTEAACNLVDADVAHDIGGVILGLSVLGPDEKKASGSPRATPAASPSTGSTAATAMRGRRRPARPRGSGG